MPRPYFREDPSRISSMLVLASNSPRRRMLLSLLGCQFEVHPARVNEQPARPAESPQDFVLRLASEKSLAVFREVSPDSVVIGADTVVVAPTRKSGTSGLVPEILGKPGNTAQAETMLRELRGRSHQVFTGLAVRSAGGKHLLTDWCVTQVTMRAYSETEVRDYVQSGDPLDKAGAYAIQHTGFDPVQSIVGCYANVVGLPLCHLTRLLRVLKLEPAKDLTDGCLTPDGYDCQLVATIQQQHGG